MIYKTNEAIILNGDRIERGAKIELSEADVARLGNSVSLVAPASPVKKEEIIDKPIEKLSYDELKAKCKELGLSAKGSKADLLEKIKLQAS